MITDTSREEAEKLAIELTNATLPERIEIIHTAMSHLITQIKAEMPKKIDMLDVGELGGADGRSGYSAVAVSHRNGYNDCLTEVTALLDKWEKQ